MSNIEYEAKFLDINRKEMREKLVKVGAKIVHEKKKYIRAVFHRCTDEVKGYARIRDENGKITMTVKIYNNPKFPEEYEVTIKDTFENGLQFLKSLGLKQKALQETYREKWTHPLVHEITFDDIPGLPTYMEIDCTGENKLNEMIKLLDLDESKKRFGAFDATYNEYYNIPKDEINDETPMLTFKNILNEIHPRKNADLLKKIAEKYKDLEGGFSKNKYKFVKKIITDNKNYYNLKKNLNNLDYTSDNLDHATTSTIRKTKKNSHKILMY